MATKKTNTKKHLEKSVYNKFFSLLGKARVMAYKLSNDKKYIGEVTKSFRSIEKKLYSIGNDYRWGAMTNYK